MSIELSPELSLDSKFPSSCGSDDNDVLFLFNERPLQVPGCQANGLCKLSFLMERFSRFVDSDCSNIFCTAN